MERECQERGEKQVCMSQFYEIWHEKIPDVKVNTFLSDFDGVNTNNLGFEHVNKVFTPLLFKRTKGKHPWKNQGSSFHLTKCSKDLQNAKIVRGLKSTINKVKKGNSQIT